MAEPPSANPAPDAYADADLVAYRPVSGWALVGLGLGLFSPLALFGPRLWPIPVAAGAVSVAALVRILRSPAKPLGRKAALVGLGLALVFGTASAAWTFSYQWRIRIEARRVALQWFEHLARNEPERAHPLILSPAEERSPPDRPWEVYRRDPRLADEMRKFVADPLVHTLLALGDRARVRYYETDEQETQGAKEVLGQVYTVSYEENGRTKTFFAHLLLHRTVHPTTGRPEWQVRYAVGGIRPLSWREPGAKREAGEE
ncbi:MAG: hypothetical protein ACYC35_17925 [Pirellulales bacterium]